MTKQDILKQFSSENPISDADAAEALTVDRWQEMFNTIVSQKVSRERWVASKGVRMASLVAGVAAIVIVVPTLWSGGPTGPSPAAADALHRAANATRSQRALPAPGPGEYLYRKTEQRQTSMYIPGPGMQNFLFTEAMEMETWISQDGSGRSITGPSTITFPTAADEAAWRAAGEPQLDQKGRDQASASGELYSLDLSEVPTDPDELLAAIERREIIGGDGADWVTFQIIGELLHLAYSSPEHRAAVYEVAANFPGVDYEGRVTDPLGRTGDSVSYDGGGSRRELLFRPSTGELLAERIILLEQEENLVTEDTWPGTSIAHAGPPGTIVWWNVYVEAAVVDSTDSRP